MRLRLLVLLLLIPAPAALAQIRDAPLLDQLEVQQIGRDLVAFGTDGVDVRERLHLGEQVRWIGSRGGVGVIVTDERVLAVGRRSTVWQERRYERGERPPAAPQLGERVALLTTSQRALGFHERGGDWIEYRLGPQESLHDAGVGEEVGVVVTSRHALGLTPLSPRFQLQDLQLRERIERVDAGASLATVRTSQRVLVFRAGTGSWSEQRREIHE